MVDVVFDVAGGCVPRDYPRALGIAVAAVLPWLATTPGAALHRLNTSAGGSDESLLLSGRTRLTLRVPRTCVDDARALSGRSLDVAGRVLRVGPARLKELLPWGTLYAHLVAVDDQGHTVQAARTVDGDESGSSTTINDRGDGDELTFLRHVEDELDRLGVPCRTICGREQLGDGGRPRGHSVMLDGLSPSHALRVLEHGLGAHRLLGCGVFVPHKSAAAVGAPM